jgi:protein tyrosine/serine phosphatase
MTQLMTQTPALAQPKAARRSWRRWSLVILVLGLAATLLPEVCRVALGSNFHEVLPGRLYRAAQPSAASLKGYIHAYGIRTVINLRGPNPGEDWFEEEERVTKRCGVDFVSVNMSASDKPQEQNLKLLIETFDQCETPILVHCTSGSDRSGFASACYLLLKTDTPSTEARSQLSLRYGHFPWGRAGCQNQVLDQYEDWLRSQGLAHEPEHFRRWATKFYKKDDWPSQ